MGAGKWGGLHASVIEWTPERVALLIEMVQAKRPYSFIAEKLGYPGLAHACSAKVQRLRVDGNLRPAEPVPTAIPGLAIIGFQLRRLPWEPTLDNAAGAPHMLSHHGAES